MPFLFLFYLSKSKID